MNSSQLAKIFDYAKKISSKQGKGAIYHLGSDQANAGIPRWSTGLEGLDDALGGGMPKGRQVAIYGKESSGKTSLAYHLCAQHPVSLFIPAEGTFDAKRARQFGNAPKRMLVYRDCKYAEDIIDKILEFARLGIPLIVVDSVPGMQCKSEYDQVEKTADKQPQYGQLSRLFSRTMKNIEDTIEKSGTTIVWLNQVRANMNAGPFGDPDTMPGGKAFKNYMSVIIKIFRRDWINITNKNPANTAQNKRVGIISKIKVIKSKVCNPLEEREFPMIFDKGYISHEDIVDERKRLMKLESELYKKRKDNDD